MDPVFKVPPSPGFPLFPVSPERVNRQHLPQSPLLPSGLSTSQEDSFISPSKASSDVQGKVAQFNNLSKEAIQRRKDNEAALRRAVVGREEAESETKRLKEENKLLQKEMEEGRSRERRVGERVESVMEELQRLKETQSHSQTLYEKEVRRARKEAFKSSSALVKLQEELKTTRNRFTLMREDVEAQKRKVEEREKEAFAAQYQLVGVQEELEGLRQQIKVTQEERDALKTNLKEEEVARIAAEGRIPLPSPHEPDEFSSPKKLPPEARRDSGKENMDPVVIENEEQEDELALLKKELNLEKKLHTRAEDQVEFMKLECQFRCCSCRLAESQGIEYIHDGKYAVRMAQIAADTAEAVRLSPETSTTPPFSPTAESPENFSLDEDPQDTEPLIEFSPTTGTFRTIPSPARQVSTNDPPPPFHIPETLNTIASQNLTIPLLDPLLLSDSPSLLTLALVPEPTPTISSPQIALTSSQLPTPPPSIIPSTPRPLPTLPLRPQLSTRIISTTTTIPLAESFSPAPLPSTPFFDTALTMSREEALEQIRQRRGRARSIAAGQATPRKAMVDLGGLRRDCSAPTARGRMRD